MILNVPGATLHYDVTGSGPTLLLIPGGPADAGVFAKVVGPLAEHYTVVTYDPRGIARSAIDGPPGDKGMEEHADDAHRLLAELGTVPAYIVASSGGAATALELAVRHPEQVAAAIAHEPPFMSLLEDTANKGADPKELNEIFRTQGVGPAMGKFLSAAGLAPPADAGPPPPEMAEAMARMQPTLEYFLGHLILAVDAYTPDIEALQASSTRITVAIGEESAGQPAHDAGRALAAELGTDPVLFPGNHGGFADHPEEFAAKIRSVFGDA
jgi:pimeloyl-ACP methyl ester carboxylesterase